MLFFLIGLALAGASVYLVAKAVSMPRVRAAEFAITTALLLMVTGVCYSLSRPVGYPVLLVVMLIDLRKRNLALVVIEHHMDLIMSIADRIVMIDQGACDVDLTPFRLVADAFLLARRETVGAFAED